MEKELQKAVMQLSVLLEYNKYLVLQVDILSKAVLAACESLGKVRISVSHA